MEQITVILTEDQIRALEDFVYWIGYWPDDSEELLTDAINEQHVKEKTNFAD